MELGRLGNRLGNLRGATIVAIALNAACSTTRVIPPALPPITSSSGTSVIGTASWYGPGFNGHRTSSGAIYDQEGLTAASVLFPLGTRLRVTNLANDRQVDVTVNDHGPYVKGRGLDLSHRAAQQLAMIGQGTARVRMAVLQTPAGGPAIGQRYFVRVASFADADRASTMRVRLAAAFPDVTLTPVAIDGSQRYRIQMGAFMDRSAAEFRAMKLARLGYSPLIVSE
jgi:rare lipoprotein A